MILLYRHAGALIISLRCVASSALSRLGRASTGVEEMNRRHFLTSTGAASLLATQSFAAPPTAAPPAQPVLMKLGDQTAPTNDVHLQYLARYGVRNICGYPEIEGDRLYATVDELKRMVDMAAKYGISIDCTAPPFPRVQLHRPRKTSCHHARREPRARSRHRAATNLYS